MLPHKHFAVSTVVGAMGWWGTNDPLVGLVGLAAGVLPDLDHAVDYYYYYRHGSHRLFLPFHGYEYAVIGGILAFAAASSLLGIATISYLIHLLADQFENRTHKLGYSLLFRAWHRFRIEGISTMPEAAIRGREDDLRMLRSLFRKIRRSP